MKNIGKPCALIAHARFDEGEQAKACSLLYPVSCGFLPFSVILIGPFRSNGASFAAKDHATPGTMPPYFSLAFSAERCRSSGAPPPCRPLSG
jgi:hypothetical protein